MFHISRNITNYVNEFLIVKIVKNSYPNLINKYPPVPMGRWTMCGKDEIKSFYANVDHCGDHICGNPENLKKHYPKYFNTNK